MNSLAQRGRQGWLIPTIATILTTILIAGFVFSGPLILSSEVTSRLDFWGQFSRPSAELQVVSQDRLDKGAQAAYGSPSLRSSWSWSSLRFGKQPPKPPEPPKKSGKWLLTVHTSPDMQLQRNLVRETWMRMYPYPACEFKFLLGSWTPEWDALLRAENATHGDIWSMPDFREMEDEALANRVKNWEFLKLLVEWRQEGRVQDYTYVSKVDSDLFLNIPEFWDSVMAPRMEGRMNNTRTLIGVMCAYFGHTPFEYACGRMYTMSWDLVELYAELYTNDAITDTFEDVLTGRLLYENNETYHPVWIDNDRMDDLLDERMENGEEGVIQSDTISVHRLKDPQKFLNVASFFDENGYNGNQQDIYTRAEPYLRQEERFAAAARLEEERMEKSALENESLEDMEDAATENEQHELRLVQSL